MKKILLALCLFFVSFSVFAALTLAQQATLKADIIADQILSQKPMNSDGAYDIAAAYNLPAAVDYYVWKTSISTSDIFDQITWANFTPQDVPDGTQTWANRSLACQGKQFNVQTILTGRDSINPSKANIRAGLQDALTGLPSGASGANKSAGWTNVNAVLYRKTTRAEKLFATGNGTTGSPSLLGYEGNISYQDVELARNN